MGEEEGEARFAWDEKDSKEFIFRKDDVVVEVVKCFDPNPPPPPPEPTPDVEIDSRASMSTSQ